MDFTEEFEFLALKNPRATMRGREGVSLFAKFSLERDSERGDFWLLIRNSYPMGKKGNALPSRSSDFKRLRDKSQDSPSYFDGPSVGGLFYGFSKIRLVLCFHLSISASVRARLNAESFPLLF